MNSQGREGTFDAQTAKNCSDVLMRQFYELLCRNHLSESISLRTSTIQTSHVTRKRIVMMGMNLLTMKKTTIYPTPMKLQSMNVQQDLTLIVMEDIS